MSEVGERRACESGHGEARVADAWHVIDASMHDLRTPLAAMSGWLEVLEARLGDAAAQDSMTTRALQGLRRAIEQQTRLLDGYAKVADTHRAWPPAGSPCPLPQALIAAIGQLDSASAGRLAPLIAGPVLDPGQQGLSCLDANGRLVDALAVLLSLLSNALGERGRANVRFESQAIVIDVLHPDAKGSVLAAFCSGPDKVAARASGAGLAQLWSARQVLERCGIEPRFDTDPDGEGFSLSLLAQFA